MCLFLSLIFVPLLLVLLLHCNSAQAFKPGKPLSFCCTFDAKPKPKTDDGPVEDAALADTA